MSLAIHTTAVVDPRAQVGADVEIGAYCVIGPQVRVGDRTKLHSNVVLEGDTWIGADCELFPFAVLGSTPQDKKLRPDETGGKLRIGDHNRIREHATIHGGTSFGGGITRIGDRNMLLVGCHVGHDATIGNDVVFTNGAMAAGHTEIRDGAILGALVGVHQFARVGELAMVGAGSMVSHDVPPFAMVQGDRARLVGVNVVGLQRNGYSPAAKAAIRRMFRLLFWRGGAMEQKIAALRDSPFASDPSCTRILDFVASSRRGICMPRGSRRAEAPEEREFRNGRGEPGDDGDRGDHGDGGERGDRGERGARSDAGARSDRDERGAPDERGDGDGRASAWTRSRLGRPQEDAGA